MLRGMRDKRQMALQIPGEEEARLMAQETGEWGVIGEPELIRQLQRAVSENTW